MITSHFQLTSFLSAFKLIRNRYKLKQTFFGMFIHVKVVLCFTDVLYTAAG